MTSKKTTKAPPTTTPDEYFLVGLDENGKPKGARFAKMTDPLVLAGLDMYLTGIYPGSTATSELGMKLPRGRLYASGKAFVPRIKRDLYEKFVPLLENPNDGTLLAKLTVPPTRLLCADADEQYVPSTSPSVAGLPRSWEAVTVGHMVLIQSQSADEGWWEAVVIAREEEMLTLRYRDYPRLPKFQRHLSAVALVNPGPV